MSGKTVDMVHNMFANYGAVLGVTFWMDKDFAMVVVEDFMVAEGWKVEERPGRTVVQKVATIGGVQHPTARYTYVNILHPQELIVKEHAEGDTVQIKTMIEAVTLIICFSPFNRERKVGSIFRVESYRSALAILKFPTTIIRDYMNYEFKVSWAWAINANTKSMQPRENGSPTKEGSGISQAGSGNTAKIIALQNQVKLMQKMGIKEVKCLKYKIDTESNKNRMVMFTLMTKNNRAINKSMEINHRHQMQTQIKIHVSINTIQAIQAEVFQAFMWVDICQLFTDPSIKAQVDGQVREYKA